MLKQETKKKDEAVCQEWRFKPMALSNYEKYNYLYNVDERAYLF